jgi:hypothetical protein
MEQGQRIGNVGLLDIRHTEAESIEAIEYIGNVGTVLYSRATAPLLTKLKIGNIGSSLEVPDDTQLVAGQITIHRDYFKHQDNPLNLMIAGQMIINPDVPADELSAGLGSLYVAGQIVCPEHLIGPLQAKIKNLAGQTVVYNGEARIIMGKLKLDAAFLHGLDDGVSLLVMGKLDASDLLDDALLVQKISEMQVMGKLLCRQENVETVQSLLTGESANVTVIPTGYEVIDRPVTLDAILLGALGTRKLYSSGRIEIAAGVTAELLDSEIDGLKSEDLIICPKALSAVMVRKVDLLTERVIFYEGELWVVDGEETLRPQRFDFVDSAMTLLVTGELVIDPSVEPSLLAERLHQIVNFGEIQCTPAQMGAVQARLSVDEGALVDSTAEESDEFTLGNAGQLTL